MLGKDRKWVDQYLVVFSERNAFLHRWKIGRTQEDIDKIADILRELGDHYLEEDVASIPLSLTAYMKVTSFNPVVYEVCYMDKERKQRTVEEEKLRKEAVQELLIYQG